MKIRGFAQVYPRAHINTDEIIPARYLTSQDPAFLAQHAMEDIDTEFVKRVKPGDILVAGADFGCGSSREHAVWALKASGIQAVVATNFARIFFRNCINNAFLVLECVEAAEGIETGDEIEIDLPGGTINNHTKGTKMTFVALSDFARQLIDSGGLLQLVKKRVESLLS